MSSILTNNGAMVALQTLRNINADMAKTQNEISTGKSVATAKDSAAVWAISKVMESDVAGFKAISDSLALGRSTTAVARSAAGQVTDLLQEMKGKIVAAQEDNVDRSKLQDELSSLRNQITSITSAAQFNGLNMLSNRETTAGSGTVNVLSSLDRASDGSVAASQINVRKMDLGQQVSSVGGTATAAGAALDAKIGGAASAALAGDANPTPTTRDITIVAGSVVAGDGYSIGLSAGAQELANANTSSIQDIRYVARDGDTAADVARGLVDAINRHLSDNDVTALTAVVTGAGNNVVQLRNSGVAADTVTIVAQHYATAGNTIGGGLERMATFDISTEAGARSALEDIESLIQTSINAGAAFGTSEKRLEIQNEFVSNLMDSLRSGIGSLVDADMEAVSARLQALQVQQQLGVQSLSIANQAPQSILSLFR